MEEKKNEAIEKFEKLTGGDEVELDAKLTEEYEDFERARENLRERAADIDREEKLRRARAREAKKRLKRERAESAKTEKEQRARERAAKREMLARETESERKERVAAEKEAKANFKAEKKRGGKKGFNGYLAAIVTLSVAVVVLGTALFVGGKKEGGEGFKQRYVETAFYNFGENIDGVDTALSKLIVSADKKRQQKLLGEVSLKSRLAADSVSLLPIQDENKFSTVKFANQVSDYAKSLNNRLIDGDTLTEEDFETLKKIERIFSSMRSELNALNADMGDDFDFSSIIDDGADNIVLDKFAEFENGASDYPKLIYDGPFSDALKAKTVKGLPDEAITLDEAKEIFKNLFGKEDIKHIEEAGETAGKIETYDFKGKVAGDVEIYASISKRGGKLIAFNYFADCKENKFGLDECVKIAEDFLAATGLKDMKAVWATDSGPTAYINFAYEKDGVIVYGDMIKATVCKERGVVSNFDAREYYLNHCDRIIPSAKISEEEARGRLSKSMSIETARLTLIPYGADKEALCYEFACNGEDGKYYIYVDAENGEEREIFKVVSSAEGDLLV